LEAVVSDLVDLIDKYILPETTPTSPAIASLGALYVAWKGDGNDSLNLIYSTDYGRTFQGKFTFAETSPLAPALCAHNGMLILAWRGDGNSQLNVAQVNIQNGVILGLLNKVTVNEDSPCAPSLASLNGRLYLAWKGDGNDNFNILTSQDNGRSFGGKWTSPENTPIALSICGHTDNCLYAAWKGDGNNNLNVQRIILDSTTGNVSTFGSKVTLPETSDDSPSIASFSGQLFIAWRGSGNTNLNVASETANFGFGNKITSSNTSDHAPALCAYGRILAIGWKGTGSDNINVAQASNYNVIGTGRPRYKVLALIYAPPGTNGGKSSSYVEYGTTSTTGTTTTTSSSFKDGIDVTASVGVNLTVVKLGASGEFSASDTTTDTDSLDIKKTTTTTIHVPGPAEDGIDHDHDLFYLWLNPLINLSLDPENNVQWSLSVDGPTMNLQYAYVSWLKNPATMPAGVAAELKSAGLTAQDYQAILALDPFTQVTEMIHPYVDPNRYLPTTQSFPYIPPLTASDPVATLTDTISDTVTQSHTHSIQTQYSVSMSLSASLGGDKDLLSGSLKADGSLTWTDTSTTTSTSISTQSATVSIGGPAYGYSGATDVLVYWDCIYNSFLFATPTVPIFHSGTLLGAAGKALAGRLVSLKLNGKTYRTYTDANGAYRFYDVAGNTTGGEGTLVSGNDTLAVKINEQLSKSIFKLKSGNPTK
jgi:hypothetical protein